MLKRTHKIIEGISLVLLIITGGYIYIEDAGSKTSCRAGWLDITTGEYEGYHKCITNSGDRVQLCYDVYNSSNTENYWCQKGKIKIIDDEIPIEEFKYKAPAGDIHCDYKGCEVEND